MHSSVAAYNAPTTGSVSVTLAGTGFGMVSGSVLATVGHTKAEASCWYSTTGIMIRAASGIGSTRRHSITAGILSGTYSAGMSYNSGSLNVHLSGELRNGPATGSTFVTVTGAGFSQSLASSRTRFLGSAAESTKWTSGIEPTKGMIFVIFAVMFVWTRSQRTDSMIMWCCRNCDDTQNSSCECRHWLIDDHRHHESRECNTGFLLQCPRGQPHARH